MAKTHTATMGTYCFARINAKLFYFDNRTQVVLNKLSLGEQKWFSYGYSN